MDRKQILQARRVDADALEGERAIFGSFGQARLSPRSVRRRQAQTIEGSIGRTLSSRAAACQRVAQ